MNPKTKDVTSTQNIRAHLALVKAQCEQGQDEVWKCIERFADAFQEHELRLTRIEQTVLRIENAMRSQNHRLMVCFTAVIFLNFLALWR